MVEYDERGDVEDCPEHVRESVSNSGEASWAIPNQTQEQFPFRSIAYHEGSTSFQYRDAACQCLSTANSRWLLGLVRSALSAW